MSVLNKRIFILVLLAVLVIAGYLFLTKPDEKYIESYIGDYTTVKHLKYNFNLKNVTPREIKGANVTLSVPVAIGTHQKTVSVDVSEDSKLFRSDENQQVYISYDKVEKSEIKNVIVEAQVAFSEQAVKDTNPSLEQYLQPEEFVESAHPEIIKLSTALKDEEITKATLSILDWLNKHKDLVTTELAKAEISKVALENEAVPTEQTNNAVGALAVLNKQHLSKSGLLYLYLAINRSLNIPARGVVGFDFTGNKRLPANQATLWAEYYDGEFWRLVNLDSFKPVETISNFIAFKVIEQVPGQAGWEPYSILHEEAAFVVDVASAKVSVY